MRTRSAIEDVAGTSSASVLTSPTATPRARNEPAAAASQEPPPPTRPGGTRKCEDCQDKSSSFGLPDEQTRRWCKNCARSHPGSLSSRMVPRALAKAGCPSKEARRPAAGGARRLVARGGSTRWDHLKLTPKALALREAGANKDIWHAAAKHQIAQSVGIAAAVEAMAHK